MLIKYQIILLQLFWFADGLLFSAVGPNAESPLTSGHLTSSGINYCLIG